MKRILLVDDEQVQRRLLTEILSPLGAEIVEAENGNAALKQLESSSFDLLIMDRAMPQMDGLETLHRLREIGLTLPVIMISAFGDESYWAEAVSLGASDYLVRPVQEEALFRAIRKVWEKKL